MKKITLKWINFENFKKFTKKRIVFDDNNTIINGRNASGKSSVADGFSWVMFNKSSTGNAEGKEFRPRRYDESGKNIDHVPVIVEMLIEVDGVEIKIKKTQKQDWVRHKGDDFDSYMGDKTEYEWNDVTVSATKHKKKVEEIISEEVFRIVTNPAMFPNLQAKKQREFLLENVAQITDEDVFSQYTEFADVKNAMGNGTLEELIAKNKKALSGYAKKQEEIPIRIDQERRRFAEIPDFEAEKEKLIALQSQLADIESKLENTGKAYERVNELKSAEYALKGRLAEVEAKITSKFNKALNLLRVDINKANEDFQTANMDHVDKERRLNHLKDKIAADKKILESVIADYRNEWSKTISEDAFICPTCGQEVQADKKQEIIDKFENQKAANLKHFDNTGKALRQGITDAETKILTLETEIQVLKDKKIESMKEQNRLEVEIKDLESKGADYESDKEYISVKAEISALEAEIASVDTSSTDTLKEQLKTERASVQAQIDSIKEALVFEKVIEQSKASIEALKAEMQEITQKLANCEKLESQIEKFNRAKMDLLSEKINDKFKLVKWKLFEQQKNGRFVETCVCMFNGSPYGENTTSATERMMCGMDIISTLQDIYQVKAPIFLDDADLYNTWNIPKMDCQLIQLCVSTDADLVVSEV